jgi:molecular chaperone GrpE
MTNSQSKPDNQADEPEEPATDTSEASAPREVEEVESELADVKDRLLRALAEQENVRRRAAREIEDARKQVAGDFARDVLSAADNLRRALDSAPEGKETDETVRLLLAGVAATERALLEALERHGISRIDPLGQQFDPHHHHAAFAAEAKDHPAGTVIQVLQPGYVSHGRLLRPAMVAVAKGGNSTGSDEESE